MTNELTTIPSQNALIAAAQAALNVHSWEAEIVASRPWSVADDGSEAWRRITFDGVGIYDEEGDEEDIGLDFDEIFHVCFVPGTADIASVEVIERQKFLISA